MSLSMTLNFDSLTQAPATSPTLLELPKLTKKVLESYNVEQLKEICRREGIAGFASKKRAELGGMITKARQTVISHYYFI